MVNVGFRTKKNGQVFPVSGISSTSIIGAPVSKTLEGTPTKSQIQPLDFRGQKPSKAGSGGVMGQAFQVERYLSSAKQAVNQFKDQQSQVEGTKNAKDFLTATDIAEPARKEEVKERNKEIQELRDIIKDLPIGRSKKQKSQNDEFKEDISATIKQAENDKTLIERMNWSSSEQALKFAAQHKGDKEAKKILEEIQKGNYKKARKLAEERARKNAKIVSDNSRIASMEGQEILTLAGLSQNDQGQYVPTAETPEIASENLGIDLTPEELMLLSKNTIQAPPKLDPSEILVLASSDEGQRRLQQWGYLN